LTGLG